MKCGKDILSDTAKVCFSIPILYKLLNFWYDRILDHVKLFLEILKNVYECYWSTISY